ncbi:unnamed protein product [Nezara viridula]|uniref:Uncharacterized protein n=1 Tax=Nezara viridula TaxID=85310 RepID=A0A9P0MW84_NEZVI|nr:unnamed protein product [Nezara viridula]
MLEGSDRGRRSEERRASGSRRR